MPPELRMPSEPRIARAQDQDALRIYFADVEGGQATPFVTPSGVDRGS
jgi:hypothetical protein